MAAKAPIEVRDSNNAETSGDHIVLFCSNHCDLLDGLGVRGCERTNFRTMKIENQGTAFGQCGWGVVAAAEGDRSVSTSGIVTTIDGRWETKAPEVFLAIDDSRDKELYRCAYAINMCS